jgi:predicted transcriptional regulator
MKLYEIANQYQEVLSEICNEETGEINETALVRLEEVKDSIKEKGIAVASFIENIEAEEKAIDAAIDKMERRKKQLANQSTFLVNYLQSNMERCAINEISCPYFVVKLRKCPLSVDITDELSIPDEYKKRKEVVSIDKLKIKEEITNGVVVPGASLKQNLRLEIR